MLVDGAFPHWAFTWLPVKKSRDEKNSCSEALCLPRDRHHEVLFYRRPRRIGSISPCGGTPGDQQPSREQGVYQRCCHGQHHGEEIRTYHSAITKDRALVISWETILTHHVSTQASWDAQRAKGLMDSSRYKSFSGAAPVACVDGYAEVIAGDANNTFKCSNVSPLRPPITLGRPSGMILNHL